jgi:hypothetical protein
MKMDALGLEQIITALFCAPVIAMDGLLLACLMGICGLPASTGRLEMPLLVQTTTPIAVTATVTATARPPAGSVLERPVPQDLTPESPATVSPEPAKLSRAAIAAVVDAQVGSVKRCYERGLVEDETFTGTLEVGWKIQVDGRVSAVSLIDATQHNAATEDCLLGEIMRWQFPPSSEPTAVGVYPFALDARLLTRHAGRRAPSR